MSEQITVEITAEDIGKNLLEVLVQHGIGGAFCNKKGDCGRCRVRFLKTPPLPSHADRKCLTPEELRAGYRLACTVMLKKDCRIELDFKEGKGNNPTPDMSVITAFEKSPEVGNGKKFIAIDIGTTTVAMQLIDGSGKVLKTHTFLNPQRAYGLDVIARIQAAQAGYQDTLKDLIREDLTKGIQILEQENQAELLVIAGNTTMLHLLQGYEVSGLGIEPFSPVSLSFQDMTMFGHRTIILPGISAFVGADITAGLYRLAFDEGDRIRLLIDLGTNGEMVMGNNKKRLATATAAGPAFEGGASVGVFGADIIAITAKLLKEKKIDHTGLLQEPYFEHGIEVDGILLKQEHIRQLQMAKAAVRAGIEILIKEYEIAIEMVEEVYLAGGFGCFLNVESAFETGLLPQAFRGKATAVGNTSLAGSILFGKREEQSRVKQLAERTIALNLANITCFEELYIKYLSF